MADVASTELRLSCDNSQPHSCLYRTAEVSVASAQVKTKRNAIGSHCRTLQSHTAAPATRQARTVTFTSTCTKCGYLKTARTNDCRSSRGLEKKRRHRKRSVNRHATTTESGTTEAVMNSLRTAAVQNSD